MERTARGISIDKDASEKEAKKKQKNQEGKKS